MEKPNSAVSAFESAVAFESEFNQKAWQILSEVKADCSTYGDVDTTLSNIKRDLAWGGHTTAIALIDRAIKFAEVEKSRLPITSSS